MPRSILMDEIHLQILIPSQLPTPDTEAIRRLLKSTGFQIKLRSNSTRVWSVPGAGQSSFHLIAVILASFTATCELLKINPWT